MRALGYIQVQAQPDLQIYIGAGCQEVLSQKQTRWGAWKDGLIFLFVLLVGFLLICFILLLFF